MGYDTTGRRDGSLHNHNDSVPFVIVRVRLPSEIQTRRVIPPSLLGSGWVSPGPGMSALVAEHTWWCIEHIAGQKQVENKQSIEGARERGRRSLETLQGKAGNK